MDFYTNQNRFIQIANSILDEQQSRLEKIRALCDFVVIEDGLTPDETAVAARILRQLIWLGEQCIKEFKLTCKEIEPDSNIEFGICECNLEGATNGVIAIYGFTNSDLGELPTIPNMDALPRFINSYERIILVLDVYGRVECIPWKI